MKESQQKLLTIAIPTYNRSDDIKGLLCEIYKSDSRDFCVIVSDNGSTDDTIEQCKYFERFDNFLIIQNATNLGFDQNIHCLINCASSTYIWFLSDDDRVSKELIEKVIKLCKKNCYASLLIDAQVVIKDNTKSIIVDSLAKGDVDYVVPNINCIDSSLFLWSTLLSSIVVRRQYLSLEKIKLAMGSNFTPLAIYWSVSQSRSSYYLRSIKLTKRDGNISAFGAADPFIWLNGMILARKFLCSYGFQKQNVEEAVASVFKKGVFNPSGIVAHYLLSRIKHRASHEIRLLDIYRISHPTFTEKIAIVFIALLPYQILTVTYKVLKLSLRQIKQIQAIFRFRTKIPC